MSERLVLDPTNVANCVVCIIWIVWILDQFPFSYMEKKVLMKLAAFKVPSGRSAYESFGLQAYTSS